MAEAGRRLGFGNTIDGCQAEYVLVPDAMANLTPVPTGLTDEQVLMCPDIMSTGFGGAQSGRISISVIRSPVFAQGPIGLCATAGAKLVVTTTVIGVDRVPARLDVAHRLGAADIVVDFSEVDAVEEIMRLTDGRGVDVAIEALGTQATFRSCLRVLRPPAGCCGVYSTDLRDPLGAFAAGLGDHTIVTTLCRGGKGGCGVMSVIASRRVDLAPLKPPTGSSSTISRQPMSCSPTSGTASSRWRSRPRRPHLSRSA